MNNADAEALPRAPAPAGQRRLPVSGSEDIFVDLTYGAPKGKGNNNCYAWAIGNYRNAGTTKLQPGNLSGAAGELNLGTCAAIAGRAAADLRGRAYPADPDAPCRPGYYKVMAFLAKGRDYHWYKQHRHVLVRWPADGRWKSLAELAAALGVPRASVYAPREPPRPGDVLMVRDARLWSHKRGLATGPLLHDACGKPIVDPRRACRRYDAELDYTDFCGAMCVKSRGHAPTRRTRRR